MSLYNQIQQQYLQEAEAQRRDSLVSLLAAVVVVNAIIFGALLLGSIQPEPKPEVAGISSGVNEVRK